MSLKDIIELAKQGYKPSDIKELIALSQEPEQEPEQDTEQEHEQETEQVAEQETEQETKQEQEQETDDKDRIIEELRKKLQNENLSVEDKIKTSTEILNNLLKDM